MTAADKSKKELLGDIDELNQRLAEAEEILHAIRRGEVDGVLGDSATGEQIYILQGAERPYRVFFEAMNEGALTVAFDGSILYCNKRFADLARIPLEKLAGMSFLELVAEDSQPAVAALLAGLGQESRALESSLQPQDGTVVPVNISMSPFKTTGLEAICLVVTDLSQRALTAELRREVEERRKAEGTIRSLNERLGRKVEELQAANSELEGFTYSVTHDLRAPIRHIAGFTKLLGMRLGAELNDEGLNFLRIISSAADNLGILVDELLEFSRIGRTEIAAAEVDLGPLIAQLVEDSIKRTPSRQIEWRVDELPVVHGDATMLRFAVENLLGNAVKFTSTRPQARIEIGRIADEKRDIVFVKDNGVGFDMAFYDKLFGVFQRLHRQEEFPGTGIGLANVQRIIRRHGGEVWAEGKTEAGATFFFALPKEPQGTR